MRYTHRDMHRTFRVPFGSWLIPTIGALLCILLMKSISKETAFRFLVWTALGQIIYFSYGFRYSRRGQLPRDELVKSTGVLSPTVEAIGTQYMHNESQSDVTSDVIERPTEENVV